VHEKFDTGQELTVRSTMEFLRWETPRFITQESWPKIKATGH